MMRYINLNFRRLAYCSILLFLLVALQACQSDSFDSFAKKELTDNYIIPDEELIIESQFSKGLNSDSNYLIVFINPKGCVYTIEQEIKLLNKFYENHSDKLRVVLFGRSNSILKRGYGADFKTINFEIKPIILKEQVSVLDPVRVIVGKNFKVKLIQFSDRNSRISNENYYERITKYYESL